jgi:hypothetical protein
MCLSAILGCGWPFKKRKKKRCRNKYHIFHLIRVKLTNQCALLDVQNQNENAHKMAACSFLYRHFVNEDFCGVSRDESDSESE